VCAHAQDIIQASATSPAWTLLVKQPLAAPAPATPLPKRAPNAKTGSGMRIDASKAKKHVYQVRLCCLRC
jgi:hypothetical protein